MTKLSDVLFGNPDEIAASNLGNPLVRHAARQQDAENEQSQERLGQYISWIESERERLQFENWKLEGRLQALGVACCFLIGIAASLIYLRVH